MAALCDTRCGYHQCRSTKDSSESNATILQKISPTALGAVKIALMKDTVNVRFIINWCKLANNCTYGGAGRATEIRTNREN